MPDADAHDSAVHESRDDIRLEVCIFGAATLTKVVQKQRVCESRKWHAVGERQEGLAGRLCRQESDSVRLPERDGNEGGEILLGIKGRTGYSSNFLIGELPLPVILLNHDCLRKSYRRHTG